MPGLFSNIFDTDQAEQTASETQSHSVATDGGATIPIDLDISIEASGTYQNPDGSTTTWSSSHEISVNADVDASFQAILGTDGSSTTSSGGDDPS
jgi:hypothetical protein